MDLVELSRLQFAITVMYHFLFVPLTLGLAWILVIMEAVYVMTGKEIYRDMTQFWGKLFGINFALGVTTGITMEFQFGTNWSYYSHYVGDIFGDIFGGGRGRQQRADGGQQEADQPPDDHGPAAKAVAERAAQQLQDRAGPDIGRDRQLHHAVIDLEIARQPVNLKIILEDHQDHQFEIHSLFGGKIEFAAFRQSIFGKSVRVDEYAFRTFRERS